MVVVSVVIVDVVAPAVDTVGMRARIADERVLTRPVYSGVLTVSV